MNLKGNPINEWSSIDNLATLDRLQTLFVTSANFEGLNGLDVREMIIAKLSKLTMLNREDISAIERRSAELCKCNGLEEALKAPHENDIKRLIQIHGEPIADKNKAKKINVVKVSISYQGKSLLRPLPTSSTVSKVTQIAARLFALPNFILSRGCKFDLSGSHLQHHFSIDRKIVIALFKPKPVVHL
ncbi:unnamed protein product, partial [Mesorhabditis belari]|uniref:Uncharacterized protein n=1 Tax=Mesorhabditis belari TaxID=2138241 RepID=A0AAF3EXM6_9BILA